MKELNATAHKILDLAELYTQTKGFNAFSYKNIQNEVGIKTSSIHYYFPTKHDLALQMTERYILRFKNKLETIKEKNLCGMKRLKIFGKIHSDTSIEGKFCLCGMMASEAVSLSEIVIDAIKEFFKYMEGWIVDCVEHAIRQKTVKASIIPKDFAQMFLAILQGGMLIAITQKKSQNGVEFLVENSLLQIAVVA